MFKLISKKFFVLSLLLVISVGVMAGCGNNNAGNNGNNSADNTSTGNNGGNAGAGEKISGTVTASGSSALAPMVKEAAGQFMDANKDVTVTVTAGGSGVGLKNVADGVSNIGNSDVEAGDDFKDANLVDHIVCVAPFAIIVNKDVKVDALTKEQAAKIFKGEIKNWKEVGGDDEAITVINRPDSSGSRKLVKTIVLDGAEFTKDGVIQENSGAMKTTVSSTKGAIGYVDTPYVDDAVKAVAYEGVAYSKDTIEASIKDGSYKLYGIEHMYTKGEATGATKSFIEFIQSDDFQNSTLKELGFLPGNLLNK